MSKYLLFVDGDKVSEDRGIELVAGTNVTLTVTETDTGLPQVEIGGTSSDALLESVTFTKSGTLTTTTGATRWYNDTGATRTLVSTRGSVGTAPTGADILVDINVNGASVWASTQGNRITIAAGTNTDEGGAFDTATIADGSFVTVDIDQIGSGTAGSDLTVTLWMS